MLLLVVSTVGFLVHVYSIGYMDGDRGFWRFFAYLNLFMFSMLLLILGDNFLMLYVGWEAVGLCSYLLIGFWYKKPSAAGAAKKAFVVNRVGDFGFGLGDHDDLGQPRDAGFHEVLRADRDARRGDDHRSSPCCSSPAPSARAPSSRSTLAAGRDGGPDPGQRPHPRRDDGQRRRVHGRARQPDLRRGADGDVGGGDHRHLHRHLRRGDRADPERHQEGAGLLDRQPAGLHVPGPRASARGPRRSSTSSPTASSRACCSWAPAR